MNGTKVGTRVNARRDSKMDGVVGEVRGQRDCTLACCRGLQLNVLWPDGKRTWPCTHGMNFDEATGEWVIL